jgi:uncharacterized protein DUF4349
MPSRPTRIALLTFALALGTSCSRNEQGEPREVAEDVHETPNVSPSAAPGVAWRYEYDFQLPDGAIDGVQETHAAQCEALGPARCRITGLRYGVTNDNAVSGMLEVKLAPEIARQFGKRATADVRKAGGRLSSTEFTGEDTAPVLSQTTRAQSDLKSRMADIQKQLANRSLKDSERAQLQSQLNDLRSQLSQAQSTEAETHAKLASTPMTFNYYGKGGISGFAGRNPVMDAVRSFVASLVTMVTFVLQVLALLLPWALLLALLVVVARSRTGRAVGHFLAQGFRKTPADE